MTSTCTVLDAKTADKAKMRGIAKDFNRCGESNYANKWNGCVGAYLSMAEGSGIPGSGSHGNIYAICASGDIGDLEKCKTACVGNSACKAVFYDEDANTCNFFTDANMPDGVTGANCNGDFVLKVCNDSETTNSFNCTSTQDIGQFSSCTALN